MNHQNKTHKLIDCKFMTIEFEVSTENHSMYGKIFGIPLSQAHAHSACSQVIYDFFFVNTKNEEKKKKKDIHQRMNTNEWPADNLRILQFVLKLTKKTFGHVFRCMVRETKEEEKCTQNKQLRIIFTKHYFRFMGK